MSAEPITGCPGCGAASSENYDGNGLCWECLNANRPALTVVAGQSPAAVLEAARVDLIALWRDGIPPRRFVPGCEPWLIAGKRYLMPAPAGTGKTLVAQVIAVEVIAHGGTVAIIDVENGADEYAARLADILGDRDALAEACSERLRYYAWPALRADWNADAWAAALAGVDLAVFDSSRLVLSTLGLAEDSNDDYARFVNALLIPLARAGTTPLTLDNTGHEDKDRARGASAKADLNEVVYVLKVAKPFDRGQTGEAHLDRRRTRFAELPARLVVSLGGGLYSAPAVADDQDAPRQPFRPTVLMERVSIAVEGDPGMSKRAIRETVRGKTGVADLALELLIAESYIEARREGQAHRHYSLKAYREEDDTANRDPVTQPCPNRDPVTLASDRDPVTPPLTGARGTGHGRPATNGANRDPTIECVCADGGEPSDTFPGRCDRCYGALQEKKT